MNQTESPSILDRFNNEPEEAVYYADGDYKAFGVSRHAVSLNCISKDGNQTGISWSLYCDARFDPSIGIEVEFTHKLVSIRGQRLLPLYQYILGNRVTFIAEADRATVKLESQEQNCVIVDISVSDRVNN